MSVSFSPVFTRELVVLLVPLVLQHSPKDATKGSGAPRGRAARAGGRLSGQDLETGRGDGRQDKFYAIV